MQKRLRRLKKKLNRKFQNFLNLLALVFKLGLTLFVFFFVVLFLISRPLEIFSDYFVDHTEEVTDEGRISEDEFIRRVEPTAKEVEKTHNVRPSLLIAQAALESDWGNSGLSKEANNYFGIKGLSGREYATKEYYDDEWENIQTSFKHYNSMEDSIIDYANLIKNGTSWDADFYKEVKEASDYKEAAYAMQKAGYATDPDYASKLIHIIEKYHLYEMDH